MLKYCCTLPDYAHRTKAKALWYFVLPWPWGFDNLLKAAQLPSNWTVFGSLKVGSVIWVTWPTKQKIKADNGGVINVHNNAKLSLSERSVTSSCTYALSEVLPCAGRWWSPQEVLEVLMCMYKFSIKSLNSCAWAYLCIFSMVCWKFH